MNSDLTTQQQYKHHVDFGKILKNTPMETVKVEVNDRLYFKNDRL